MVMAPRSCQRPVAVARGGRTVSRESLWATRAATAIVMADSFLVQPSPPESTSAGGRGVEGGGAWAFKTEIARRLVDRSGRWYERYSLLRIEINIITLSAHRASCKVLWVIRSC